MCGKRRWSEQTEPWTENVHLVLPSGPRASPDHGVLARCQMSSEKEMISEPGLEASCLFDVKSVSRSRETPYRIPG